MTRKRPGGLGLRRARIVMVTVSFEDNCRSGNRTGRDASEASPEIQNLQKQGLHTSLNKAIIAPL